MGMFSLYTFDGHSTLETKLFEIEIEKLYF